MLILLLPVAQIATEGFDVGTTTMGIRLDQETRDRLKKLSKAKNRSAHFLMKEAIQRYLDSEERYELEKAEDAARWQRYLDTGEALSQSEVKSRIKEMISEARSKK